MKRLTEVQKAQMVTGELFFYSVYTPESILPTVTKDENDNLYYIQASAWERIVNAIRIVANPVLIGQLESYGFSFAVERYVDDPVRTLEHFIHKQGIVNFSEDGSVTRDLTQVQIDEKEIFNLASEFYIVNSGDGVGLYRTNESGDPELRSLVGTNGLNVDISDDDTTIELSGNFIRNDTHQTLPPYSEGVMTPDTATFDANKGNIYDYTLQASDELFELISPESGGSHTITVFLKNGATYPPLYPDNVSWMGGEPPLLGDDDIITFVTINGGDKWYGSHAGSITV